ncbi:MAG: hypothetical protein DRQ10_03265 [Candidatus Hydrothermota bacterium]|nr:MAG: hypothetical protein DRQ10_03265 [Candidatus Hydrothermae bacterium]
MNLSSSIINIFIYRPPFKVLIENRQSKFFCQIHIKVYYPLRIKALSAESYPSESWRKIGKSIEAGTITKTEAQCQKSAV